MSRQAVEHVMGILPDGFRDDQRGIGIEMSFEPDSVAPGSIMAKDGRMLGTELDLDGLLRMDSSTRMDTASKAMTAGLTPDEVRKKYHDLGPVDGGEKVFLQRQNWPLELLGSDVPPPPAQPPVDDQDEPESDEPDDPPDEPEVRAFVSKHTARTKFLESIGVGA